jgi:hypothetical protein
MTQRQQANSTILSWHGFCSLEWLNNEGGEYVSKVYEKKGQEDREFFYWYEWKGEKNRSRNKEEKKNI